MVVTRSQSRKRGRILQRSRMDNQSTSGRIPTVKKDLLDILPEEVWRLVLDKLDHGDLASCFNLGGLFQPWLEPKRADFLAEKVFALLDLSTAEKMKCRQVCRSWKSAVERDVETKAFVDETYMTYCFRTVAKIEVWKTTMLARPKPEANPFVSRNVMFKSGDWDLEVDVSEESRAFWNGVAELLELYGEYVWYIYIGFYSVGDIEHNEKIYRMLALLPNLKVLTIRLPYRQYAPPVRTLPLLQLTALQLVNNNFYTPLSTNNNLLRACDPLKLEQLKISTVGLFGCSNDCSEAFTAFRNLKRLDLYDHGWFSIRRFGTVAWPLQELCLHLNLYEYFIPGGIMSTSSLFTAFSWINKFDQLRSLTLLLVSESAHVGGRYDKNGNKDLRLTLPLLQYLTIKTRFTVGGIFSLDFVEELKSLKELRLQMRFQQRLNHRAFQKEGNPKDKIQFAGYSNRMLESNVWEVLPKLRVVELKDSKESCVYRKRREMSTKAFVKQLGNSPFETSLL